MPFVRLEISSKHAGHAAGLLNRAGQLVTEIFALESIRVKSSAFVTDVFQVGDVGQFDGFAYLSVHCFRGRPTELCERLTTQLLALLKQTFSPLKEDLSIAAYIVEIDPATTKVDKHLGRG